MIQTMKISESADIEVDDIVRKNELKIKYKGQSIHKKMEPSLCV